MPDPSAVIEPASQAAAPAPTWPAPARRRPRGRRKPRIGRLLIAATLAAIGTGLTWALTRPMPKLLPAPALEPRLAEAILAAIAPGWPARKPMLPTLDGAVAAVDGRVDAIAALDADADGRAEWGVAYAWLGPVGPAGARAMAPGFAVVRAPHLGAPAELAYEAPGPGDWEGPRGKSFEGATELASRVEAVRFGRREVGFLATHVVETSVGGRMGRGVTRAYLPVLGGWVPAWEGETETRLRHDRTDEVTTEQRVEVVDLDGNGTSELATTPGWYHRHLGRDDRGAHFTAEGPGRLVYRRDGMGFTLAALDAPGLQKRPRIRPAPPLFAVRAPRAPVIDGAFDDWDAVELGEIGQLMLDEPSQLRYRSRERRGTHDFSGAVRFMFDEKALYVRADVMDDKLRPAPAGKTLYEGDHLGLWLDMDLARDFAAARRDGDDWQLGLGVGGLGVGGPGGSAADGSAWIWVPRAGAPAVEVASAPLMDPYEGAVRGWRLEAAVPWTELGGAPPLELGPAPDARDPRLELAPRRYELRLAGAIGLGIVLTDADDQAQELAYVSAPNFAWGAPRSFNTLLLVEGRRL